MGEAGVAVATSEGVLLEEEEEEADEAAALAAAAAAPRAAFAESSRKDASANWADARSWSAAKAYLKERHKKA